jgi:hypothetical protein
LDRSNDNVIYLNNFAHNTGANANSGLALANAWTSPNELPYSYADNCYRGHLGNYWSDYLGLDDGSGGRTAGDGVGDTALPYVSDGLGDHCPLMEPYQQYLIRISGDANEDGAIDGRDVIRCKKIVLGLEPGTCGADANEDGVIDGRDVIRIKKMILGIA